MKSKKRNYRRTKKRKTKRREKKGGNVIGKGSDGVILHPSYRCGKENSSNRDVSKAFFDNKFADIEFDAKSTIEEYHIDNFFVLPITKCNKNTSELSPEDKTQLTRIFNPLPEKMSMITYPKGEMSAYEYLTKHVNPPHLDSIKQFLEMYENVAYAVTRMQYSDIVHRDFKLENVLFIHDTFKIADITFLSRIEDINYNSEYLGISRYYPFPSIYGFTALFEYPHKYTSIKDEKLVSYINRELNNPYFKQQTEYSTRLFNDYISLFIDSSIKHADATILKSYHFNRGDNTITNLSILLETEYGNKLLLFKTYLFLTIDTYSFGISLMKVAVHYFINYKTSNPSLLHKLHSIIFKCCEFSVKIKDFNEIYKMYREMVKYL